MTTEGREQTSMLNWWPAVKRLDIPTPRTAIIPETRPGLLDDWFFAVSGGTEPPADWPEYFELVKQAADAIGYPVFLRTDLASGKHEWSETCYAPTPESLLRHVTNVIEFGHMADLLGLPHCALVVREFIELDWRFHAFRGMPVAPEWRYFIRDSEIVCRHFYWPLEALANGRPDCPNWIELLRDMAALGDAARALLDSYAVQVGAAVPGHWSVDFARGRDGAWYLIDMGEGPRSWHPKDCPGSWPPCEVCGEPVDLRETCLWRAEADPRKLIYRHCRCESKEPRALCARTDGEQ
jgi:hypothetical protein